jgi:hypothetical protein
MEYEYHYAKFPALRAYIDRIGAEQLNFRRFMIKQYHGSHYYVEKVLVKIANDFSIECSAEEYAPTEEEAEAIKKELGKVEFPKSVRASEAHIQDLLDSGQVSGNLYTFWDLARKEVVMCQERRQADDGKKYYVPWTMFVVKGGRPIWRQMEPDGALPFWKPPVRRNKASLMVHEGAKTAHFIDGLVNDPERRDERKRHPWSDELALFEHWGAIGGALAIHRCDYEELRREKIEGDLYYVADNDGVGKAAAQVFSRRYGGRMFAIKFDDRFPPGWDLADAIPAALVSRAGTVETSLMDYAWPATWATKRLERTAGKAGAPGHTLTKEFAEEWIHTVNPEFFCHARLTKFCYHNQGQFDSVVAPWSDVDYTGRYLRKVWQGKGVKVIYDPAAKPGLFSKEREMSLNVYQPSGVRDYTAKEAKHVDYTLFTDFLDRLFPSDYEREIIKQWLATLMAKPGVKMNYGLLLISEMQGVGKTTLSDIVSRVLGRSNVATTSESSILGRFSEWAEKQLVVVNEIYQGHSTAAYNRLKEVITDKTLRVEKKFVSEYYVDNHVHIIACSNSMRALRLDNTDRRWFVPQVSSSKQSHEYWIRLHDWLDMEDGYRKVKQWAKDYVRDRGHVVAGSEAPWTPTKTQMVEESDSVGQELIRNDFRWCKMTCESNGEGELGHLEKSASPEVHRLATAAKDGLPIVMFDKDGVRAIDEVYNNGRSSEKTERPMYIRKIAEQEGLYVGKQKVSKPAPGYKRSLGARVISTSKELAARDPNEITWAGADAKDLCIIDLSKLALELQGL